MVDDPLEEQRGGDRKNLERQRKEQDLAERPEEPGHAAHEVAQPYVGPVAARLEILVGPKLERYARKRGRHFVKGKFAVAGRGIVYLDALATYALEYYEVVEFPMENARASQLVEVFELEPQRPRCKPQAVGDIDHACEPGALERYRKAPPE